jgi:PIN domain nuclease of toxin-antitoxin system
MPTLLDTHAWIWWSTEDARLSRRARSVIAKAQAADDLWLSLISVWELAKKVEKGHLVLDRPLHQWVDTAASVPGLNLWELSRPILIESCQLPPPFHGDPADQIIVATARHHQALVVTKDEKIQQYAHVQSLW